MVSTKTLVLKHYYRHQGKGAVCKRAGLANIPSFGFLGPGNLKIIAFYCQGSIAGKDILDEIQVQGNICQTHPFWKPHFCEPPIYSKNSLRNEEQ